MVHLGVPLSVGVQLQDAPSGQVVSGSVFLRNPSTTRHELCSPKVDFSLSSDKDFILLSLPVTGRHSLLLLPSASHSVLLCLLVNIFVFSPAPLPSPLPPELSSLFLSQSLSLSFCSGSDPLLFPLLTDLPERRGGLSPPSPPQSPRGPAGGPVAMANKQTDRQAGCQPVILLSPGTPLSAD